MHKLIEAPAPSTPVTISGDSRRLLHFSVRQATSALVSQQYDSPFVLRIPHLADDSANITQAQQAGYLYSVHTPRGFHGTVWLDAISSLLEGGRSSAGAAPPAPAHSSAAALAALHAPSGGTGGILLGSVNPAIVPSSYHAMDPSEVSEGGRPGSGV